MDELTKLLLTRILNEKGFRAHLEHHPTEALASVGFYVAAEDLPSVICLPPDDQVRALLALEPVWEHIQGCMILQSLISWRRT